MKKTLKKKIAFALASVIILAFLILLIPLDFFTHGFYCDVVQLNEINEEDYLGYFDLSQDSFHTTFSPLRDHFAGFEIVLDKIGDNASGELTLAIYRPDGKEIETVKVNISDIMQRTWHMVYLNGRYSKNTEYELVISIQNCNTDVSLILTDNDYISEEGLGNNLLLGFAYSEPTFSHAEKILILMAMISLWILALTGLCIKNPAAKKYLYMSVMFLGITTLLSWNYMFNSFDEENRERFETFQKDSDSYALGVIEGEKAGMGQAYGLGRYYMASGYYNSYSNEFASDGEWYYGYNRTEPQIQINANAYTQSFSNVGTVIQFANGDRFTVTEVSSGDGTYILSLDSDKPLNYYKYGDLNKALFHIEKNGTLIQQPRGLLVSYPSQYGLQGKVFRHLSHFLDSDYYIEDLELLCCVLTGAVFCFLIFMIRVKYDLLFAVCFGVTALLSPWIVNFAGSEYWVEFTWFFPMLIGLICSVWINNLWIRRLCYIGAYVSILGKSLCGYEYVSAVMLGLIAFLLIDLGTALTSRNKKYALQLFKTIFILGCLALAGFATAICIHASLRGEGNILAGIKSIIESDVLRRVGGGDLNNFAEAYWPSLNASGWDVVKKYFHFETDIIAGLDANLFPILFLAPIIIFIYDYWKKRFESKEVYMYIVFFITGMSWIILGKSHSYIHTHLNFVMWYFGFVQCCIYIIIKHINVFYTGKRYS